MKFSYYKEIRSNPDHPARVKVSTDFDLVERPKEYVLNGSIREWENLPAKGKNERCVVIELDKALVIEGDVVINGYLNMHGGNLKIKGLYKVGDNYAPSN